MKIDMSPQAVDTRLQRVSQLRALCLALAGPRLKRPWGVPEPVDSLQGTVGSQAADLPLAPPTTVHEAPVDYRKKT